VNSLDEWARHLRQYCHQAAGDGSVGSSLVRGGIFLRQMTGIGRCTGLCAALADTRLGRWLLVSPRLVAGIPAPIQDFDSAESALGTRTGSAVWKQILGSLHRIPENLPVNAAKRAVFPAIRTTGAIARRGSDYARETGSNRVIARPAQPPGSARFTRHQTR